MSKEERRSEDLQTTVRKLRGELATAKTMLESATAETARVRDEKARQKQRLEQQLADAEREADAARTKLRDERKSAQQRAYQLEEARDEAERQLKRAQTAARREAARLTARVDELEAQLRSGGARARTASASAPAPDTAAELARAQQDLAAAQAAAEQCARERDDLAAQLAAAKEQQEQMQKEKEEEKEKKEEDNTDTQAQAARCAELEDALADEREQCGALEGMNKRLRAELDECEEQIDQLEAQLSAAKKELLATMAELEAAAQKKDDSGADASAQALADAEARAAALAQDVEAAEKKGAAAEQRLAELEAELADARAANEELRAQQQKEKEEKETDSKDDEVARLEAQLDEEAEQHAAALARLNAQLQQLQAELDEADERADAAGLDQRRAELHSHELEGEVAALEEQVAALQKQAQAASEGSSDTAKEELGALEKTVAELKSELERTGAARDALQEQVTELQKAQAASEGDTAKEELQRLQDELQAAEHDHEEEMHGMEKIVATLKSELESAHTANEELHEQLDEQTRACAQATAARDALQEQVAELQKEPKAPQEEPQKAPQEELETQLAAAKARIAELEAQLAQQPAPRQLLTGPRRTAAPGRRAPTRRTGAQLEGAVSMGPAGLTPDQLVLKKPAEAGTEKEAKEAEDAHVLVQVKGRRSVRSWVVARSAASLNSGDVFLLDAGDTIYQWNGRQSNRFERSKGVDLAARLKRARGGRARVVVIDEGADEPEGADGFWAELGARDAVQSAEAGGDDTAAEAEAAARCRLGRYDAAADAYECVAHGRLLHEMLDARECYLLDAGGELYVWNGRSSAPAARTANYRCACALLAAERATRPPWCTAVVKCRAGGEPVLFMEKFANWPAEATLGFARPAPSSSSTAGAGAAGAAGAAGHRPEQVPVDVRALLAAEMPAPVPDVDSAADGPVEVWRVADTARVPVARTRHGHFWSAHCYIVLYTWNLGGAVSDRSYIIYFWQGADATVSEMGTAAALSLSMGKSYRGASQVRVAQFAEPAHFHRIFHGALTIHCGSEPPSLPSDEDYKEDEHKEDDKDKDTKEDEVHMFQVHGTDVADTSAVEVPPPATSAVLDTNDVFVVTRGTATCHVWRGANSNSHALDTARALCRFLCGSDAAPVEQTEGAEGAGFWAALGCAAPADATAYASASVHPPGWVARAYVFTTKTGIVTAEPLWHYVQTDLVPEAMVLLDAYHSAYLWVGDRASKADRRVALETAVAYAAAAPALDPARGKMAVLEIGAGAEPLAFRCHFHCWLPPRARKTRLALSASAPARTAPVAQSAEEALGEYSRTYTYAQLRDRAALPPTVDRSRLEMYLSDDEFAAVFGITREQYLALPAWQRLPKKKQAGLF